MKNIIVPVCVASCLWAAAETSATGKQPQTKNRIDLVFNARTVSAPPDIEKLPKTVSVSAFGAKGDGAQDDADAIQAALDSDAATVTIPPGTYRIDRTLRMGSGTLLRAAPQAVIRLADGAGASVDTFLITNRNHGRGDSDITVEGGIWDGNNEHNARGSVKPCYTGVAINFVNVRRLALRNLTVRNPDSFAIRACRLTGFTMENIGFDFSVLRPNQDGVHLNGECRQGVIRNLYAISPYATNDDMVALNADDGMDHVLCQGMVAGAIEDVTVEKIRAESAYTFVRLLCVKERIRNVVVSDVQGGCRTHAINLDRWRFSAGEVTGLIENVTLKDFRLTQVGADRILIPIQANVKNLRIENFQRADSETSTKTLVLDNGRADSLVICGLTDGQKQGMLQQTPSLTAEAFREGGDVPLLTLETQTASKIVLPSGGFTSMTVNAAVPD